jgi:hypothetical protein
MAKQFFLSNMFSIISRENMDNGGECRTKICNTWFTIGIGISYEERSCKASNWETQKRT